MSDSPAPRPSGPFRVGLVVGVTPDKWVRRWRDRRADPLELVVVEEAEQERAVREGLVDMCFVRDATRSPDLHLIPLYDEVAVVVVGADHPVAAYDEIDLADLTDEVRLLPGADPDLTVAAAVATVAAGTGVVVLPMSVARVHHRKDVVEVPVTGVPSTSVGLTWPAAGDDERVEAFVGIVRGRTQRSSRGAEPGSVRPGLSDATGRTGAAGSRGGGRPASGAQRAPGRGSGSNGRRGKGSGRGSRS